MNERLAQIVSQVKDLWNGMPARQRLVLGGAVGAVFLILLVLSFTLGGGPDKEILFSNLAAADAADVLQQLDDNGIPYEIEQNATGRATILVPQSAAYRTRIDLAAQGIPRQGSVGFEIFDDTKLGMTDDVRRINLRRALNGELERTIRALDVVEDVRVQVALPENKLFISQQQQPSAAVMLTLKPGRRMEADQVRAIQRLVGATIEGMDPTDVFVVDNRGNPLSDQLAQLSQEEGSTSVEKQFLIQQAVSNEYSRQVRTMLEGPFGAGRVEAMVKVELNFEKAEEIIKAFEAPNGRQGLVRSEELIEENFEGSGKPPGGVPGVESNVPGYTATTEGSGDSVYNKSEQRVNYEINQTERKRVVPPGAIRRVTVGVLIDGDLTDEQEASVANTVSTALGLDTERGDQVHVDSMTFATSQVLAGGEPAPAIWGFPPEYVIGLAALLAVLGLVVWLRRRARRQSSRAGIDIVVGDDGEEEALPERKVTPEERRRQQLREQVLSMAKEKPEDVAQLLKTWLLEE